MHAGMLTNLPRHFLLEYVEHAGKRRMTKAIVKLAHTRTLNEDKEEEAFFLHEGLCYDG